MLLSRADGHRLQHKWDSDDDDDDADIRESGESEETKTKPNIKNFDKPR